MSTARIAGAFYLLVFITGSFALAGGRAGSAAMLAAGAFYVVVTLLLYQLFKPVSQPVSLIAACVSLAGIVIGPLRLGINPLVFFGIYCVLIGYVSLRSKFVPCIVGALMVFAGLGWLTFASPALARSLFPWNFAPGLIGEGTFTGWLLFTRVDRPSAQVTAT